MTRSSPKYFRHFNADALCGSAPNSATGFLVPPVGSPSPNRAVTAGGASVLPAFSSVAHAHRWARFGSFAVCWDCGKQVPWDTRESDLVRLARPPAPFGNGTTDRLAGEVRVGLKAVARHFSLLMGIFSPGTDPTGRA